MHIDIFSREKRGENKGLLFLIYNFYVQFDFATIEETFLFNIKRINGLFRWWDYGPFKFVPL